MDATKPSGNPDFVALFPVCRCGKESCDRCTGFQLTPRIALALWCTAQLLSDLAYDDVELHGDSPIVDPNDWGHFDRYPVFTWKQDAQWRRWAARTYDDVVEDLASGRWPLRTCIAEEMALHLTMVDTESLITSLPGLAEEVQLLPEHPDDLDWVMIKEQLLLDTDTDYMLDPGLDGLELPDGFTNQAMGIGDYRPATWFDTFKDADLARDPCRGFRR